MQQLISHLSLSSAQSNVKAAKTACSLPPAVLRMPEEQRPRNKDSLPFPIGDSIQDEVHFTTHLPRMTRQAMGHLRRAEQNALQGPINAPQGTNPSQGRGRGENLFCSTFPRRSD